MIKFGRSSTAGTSSSYSSSLPVPFTIANLVLRFFQFIFAITVIGLYGTDLSQARKVGVHSDSRWVYAVVVGALSAITALVFAVPVFRSYWAFGWDAILL